MASRAKTTILMFIVLFTVQVWIPETGKLWSRNTETPSLPAFWTALMEGSHYHIDIVKNDCIVMNVDINQMNVGGKQL